MRKLLGPHLAGSWPANLEIVRKWQPRLCLVLSPNVDKVTQLKQACPDAIIVGRFYHDDSHYASNINARPKDFAREIHNEIASNPVTPLLDYVQSNNETNQDWEGIQKLNVYTQEWMFLADQSQAYKCAILAFSVGNPDMPHKPGDPAGFDGRMLYWQQVLPSLNYAQQKGHILLMHAYGYPTMFEPDPDWMIYRYERQVEANLESLGITNLKYMYGEIGIDKLIVGERGGYKSVPTSDQGYLNQTLQWERDQQGQEKLLGGCIYTFGDSGGWNSYDITTTNMANMVAQHYTDHAADYETPAANGGHTVHIPIVIAPEQPTPEPEPEPMPEVIWDERLTKRGIELTQYVPQPGDTGVWRIVKGEYWEEKEHTFAVTLDSSGNRKPGVTMRWWWADGKEDKPTELKPNDRWMVDFAMYTHGKSYGLKALDGPSDSVWGMGLGSWQQPDWNIHVSYHFTFQWVAVDPVKPDKVPPPPNPAPVAPTPRFKPGDTVHTAGYVNLRRTPGYTNKPSNDVTRTLPPGSRVVIHTGPRIVDNLVWWNTRDDALGWLAESDPHGAVLLSKEPVPPPVDVPIFIHPVHRPDARRVSQTFGVNEAFYKQFIYDGVPLMGHNGVDFATPVGTTIVAVDDGAVLKVGDEGSTGFGKYLILKHVWGESLYAHLSQIMVQQGQKVEQGDAIALSGNTGTSTGPHLHFGIRKNGYRRGDGWGGYINPLPYIGPDQANIKEIAHDAATEFGVDEDLLLNMLYAENKFSIDNDPSSAGAVGPAQIMPATWNEWAARVGAKNINNPVDNIRVGARYLKWCLDQFKGQPDQVKKALFAYNFGIGRVTKGDEIPVETLIYAYSIIHGTNYTKAVRDL